jgi:hypothetical protein
MDYQVRNMLEWSVSHKTLPGTILVCNKYVQSQLSTENSSLRMDYQVRNMLEWSVSNKTLNGTNLVCSNMYSFN